MKIVVIALVLLVLASVVEKDPGLLGRTVNQILDCVIGTAVQLFEPFASLALFIFLVIAGFGLIFKGGKK